MTKNNGNSLTFHSCGMSRISSWGATRTSKPPTTTIRHFGSARVWRIFDFRFTRYPPGWAAWALAVGAYVNFFAHHYIWDFRYVLIAASLALYGPCLVHYRPREMRLRMPLALGFVLVALFIWFAENIGTFAGAWVYPEQAEGWRMVSLTKLGSWYLLMILSFVLVTSVNRPRTEPAAHR